MVYDLKSICMMLSRLFIYVSIPIRSRDMKNIDYEGSSEKIQDGRLMHGVGVRNFFLVSARDPPNMIQ